MCSLKQNKFYTGIALHLFRNRSHEKKNVYDVIYASVPQLIISKNQSNCENASTYYITFIGIFHVTCLWRVEVAFIRKNKILKWILQISCTFLSSLIKGVLKCIVNMWLRLYHNSERGKHCQWYRVASGSHLEFLTIRVFWRHHQGFEDLVDKQLFGATKYNHSNQ